MTEAPPPPLALSLGDPAGIGPEIAVKAWRALRDDGPAFLVVGDHDLVASASGDGARVVRRIGGPEEAAAVFPDAIPVLDQPLRAPVVSGKPSAQHAGAVVGWIETGVGLALSGAVGGLVTAPIAKATLYEAGFPYPGHTEFVAALTAGAPYAGPRGPVMMLTAADLRTVLVTIHQPLAEAVKAVTEARIVAVARATAYALAHDFGIEKPRLALAGLNPHAGEGGALGREEIEIVGPAAARLRAEGIDCTDPRPADTLFHEAARATYDAAVCLYHDQALIPVKTLDFWGGVNVTLGLPIVRTSPDHGTGFDLAGRGVARPESLIAAIRTAAAMAAPPAGEGVTSLDDLPPLRESLAEAGLLAKKSFGQHFLLDLNVTRKIARLAGPMEGVAVLEVGPGPGGLTRALLETEATRVVAVEKDPRFLPLLGRLGEAAPGRLGVVEADALQVDEAALVGDAPARVVSNLPYNVGTPLLIKWLTGPWRPLSLTLMFQKEVAQRIVAAPGSGAYGRLAVIAQATAEARIVMALPARAFTPPPKVDSAVAHLTPRPDAPPRALIARLERVTAAAFGQRRKMLRSSLKSLGGEALARAAEVDPDARAEMVDVAGFLRLAEAVEG